MGQAMLVQMKVQMLLLPTKKTDETTSVTVNKVWEDSNNNTRPTSVTVYLLKNGEAFGDGLCSNSNGWTHLGLTPTQEGEMLYLGVKEGQ